MQVELRAEEKLLGGLCVLESTGLPQDSRHSCLALGLGQKKQSQSSEPHPSPTFCTVFRIQPPSQPWKHFFGLFVPEEKVV